MANTIITSDGRHLARCPQCFMTVDLMELACSMRNSVIVNKRQAPNQPYPDVLEDYIDCPRCKEEIIIGNSRMSMQQSISLGYASLNK